MPFNNKTVMEQKLEFVILASQQGASISELCRSYCISRRTGYKWVKRYLDLGKAGLEPQSRRPHNFYQQLNPVIEQRILDLRKTYPVWGSKKIHKLLEQEFACGSEGFSGPPPARSTIGSVLNRHGLTRNNKSSAGVTWQRFEHENPNDLWQMDFKGHFKTESGAVCHPLTMLDDYSRFNLILQACSNEKRQTVAQCLRRVFECYGLPDRILADNGSPWGGARENHAFHAYTYLEKYLMLLGIEMVHGRALHPQTQGKEERFHRTLKTELLQLERFKNIRDSQHKFDNWREQYNCIRPHEAIEFKVPASRYQPSKRKYPSKLPVPEYNSNDIVRKVSDKAVISLNKAVIKIGKAFIGERVAVRPTTKQGLYNIYFCNQIIKTINLNQ